MLAPVAVRCALALIGGAALIVVVLHDAFLTVLVPRRIGQRLRITTQFYVVTWRSWRAFARRIPQASRRETMLGYYAPLSLLLLLACWAGAMIAGFAMLQYGAARLGSDHAHSPAMLLYMSGETFFTLGFGDVTPATAAGRVLAALEAGMGFGFLGTVIGYLPTIYSAFSQREIEISLLDGRAGSPPTAAKLLRRAAGPAGAIRLEQRLADWERWSAQLLETHVSYPLLAYYRSQHLNQSWLGTLQCILDTCALLLAGAGGDTIARERAWQTFAMARHALVDLTQNFTREPRADAPERLDPATLARLRERLAGTQWAPPAGPEFEERLAAMRRAYEPYLHALAAYLLIDLPPWVHEGERRDNWQGGPWDRQLGVAFAIEFRPDEHF